MADELHEQLAEYDRAVVLTRETYPGMTRDERTVRSVGGKHLEEHAPSNRTDPTCAGCDGAPWPCGIVLGAIKYVDPHYN
jgi:hypothetical protein